MLALPSKDTPFIVLAVAKVVAVSALPVTLPVTFPVKGPLKEVAVRVAFTPTLPPNVEIPVTLSDSTFLKVVTPTKLEFPGTSSLFEKVPTPLTAIPTNVIDANVVLPENVQTPAQTNASAIIVPRTSKPSAAPILDALVDPTPTVLRLSCVSSTSVEIRPNLFQAS